MFLFFFSYIEKIMEKRDLDLTNYNESIDWKEAFKMHPSPLTPGKPLRKVMTVEMDIPSDKFLTVLGGTNGTWMLREISSHYDPSFKDEFYYISQKGQVKFIGKDCSVKTGRGRYIFSNEDKDIFLIDTDNDNIINTGFNTITDNMLHIFISTFITDYGEFAYVKDGILNIPDRNLSIKNKIDIAYIGLNYYTTFNHTRNGYISRNLYDSTDIIQNTRVYKDKLTPKPDDIKGINDEFYYTVNDKVYSTNDNSLIGTLNIRRILNESGNVFDSVLYNLEYTQVITKQKTDSGYILEVYQH